MWPGWSCPWLKRQAVDGVQRRQASSRVNPLLQGMWSGFTREEAGCLDA
ncbi:hypothetical protein PRJ_1461 [Pseudomonas sp. XWY-1]|nr:hypothetical protein PRJ_1461 [Pseudomonas sp. XWY-1]